MLKQWNLQLIKSAKSSKKIKYNIQEYYSFNITGKAHLR